MLFRILVIVSIILFTGCSNQQKRDTLTAGPDQITISGELKNGADQLVTLDLMGTTSFLPVDSVRCDAKGKFTITFSEPGMNYYALKYTEQGYITLIARPGDHLHITGTAENVYPYAVEGSEDSELLRQLAVAHKTALVQLEQISIESRNIEPGPGYSEKKQALNTRFDSISGAYHRYSAEFIRNHPGSPAILIALYNQFGPGLPVFHPLTDLEIYTFTDSALYDRYPENEAVRALHSELAAAMEQLRNQEQEEQLQKGDKAPDFVIQSIDDTPITLTEFRGKYVLLHFWASWSKPSVEENKFITECARKYGDSEFVVISVSIDDNRQAWHSAVKEQIPGWYHTSELQRWESAVANLYRIERIPANFLINPAGTIVEKDNFGENLIQAVEKHLDK
jgi:peroxiredoxin